MGYNATTGTLTLPITITEICDCIGVSSRVLRDIGRADSINPLSKYKPVESGEIGPFSDANFKAANWGYHIPPLTRVADYIQWAVNGVLPQGWEKPTSDARDMGSGWYYLKPDTWRRIQDFSRYNHKTTAPLFADAIANSELSQNSTSLIVTFQKGTFALNEFGDLADFHLGVIVAKEGSITAYFKTIVDAGADANYPTITFSKSEIAKIMGTNYGNYKVYVVAAADSVQNIDNTADNYMSSVSVRPLPVAPAVVNYKYQGTAQADIRFSFANLVVEYDYISFSLYAENTGDAAGAVGKANLKYNINARDEEGAEYSKGLAALETSGTVQVAAGKKVLIGSYEVPYAAYRVLSPPWFAVLQIFYPNSSGISTLYASIEGEYNG